MGKATAQMWIKIGGQKDPSLNKTLSQSYYNIQQFAGMTNSVTRAMVNAYREGFNVILTDVVQTYSSFEQAMADTAAIAGASVSDVERMTEAARKAGRTTTITAEDSAKALGYMALAGWSVDESIEGLLPILRLAEATGADLQTTSDLVTDSLGAVGLQVKDLTQYMDMLVATNNNANTTAEMLMESLIKTGGAAVTLGANLDFNSNFGLDELMTAIGVLGSNGIKAEQAGTALNSILTRLGANTEAQKGLDSIGVSIYDAQGQFIGLEETLYAIGEAMEGMSDERKMKALKQIAGTRYASQLSYLMASLQDGASIAESSWGKLNAEIENSVGDLDVMNARATDTLSAAAERWQSAVDDLKIGIGTTFGDDAKDLLNEFSSRMPAVIEMVDEFGEKHAYQISDLIDKAGKFAENGAEKILGLAEFVFDNSGTIFDIVKGLTVGQLALTGIANAVKLITMIRNLGGMLGPLSAVVAGATAIYVVATAIKGTMEKIHEEAVRDNLAEHFGNIALSMQEIEEVSEYLVYNGMKGLYDAFEDQNEELEKLDKNIQNTVKDLNKSDWKIEMGMELSKDDLETYKSSAESLVSDVQKYIEEARYQSSLGNQILFGDADGIEGIDRFYDSLEGEAVNAGEKLSQAINDAFEDNILTDKEEKIIKAARERLLKIYQKFAEEDFISSIYSNSVEASMGQLTSDTYEKMIESNTDALDKKSENTKQIYGSEISDIEKAYQNGDMSESEYQAAKEAAFQGYASLIADDYTKITASEISLLENKYGDAISDAEAKFDAAMDYAYKNNYAGAWAVNLFDASKDIFTDSVQRDTVGDLVDLENDRLQYMINLRDELAANGIVNQELIDQIEELEKLSIMTGSQEFYNDYTAALILSDEDKQKALKKTIEDGKEIPEGLVKAMGEQVGLSEKEIEIIIDDLANRIDEILDVELSEFEVETNVKIIPHVELSETTNSSKYYSPNYSSVRPMENAIGGIYDNEILTTVAESGSEAIIPINSAARSKNLWLETGERMGMITRDKALLNSFGGTTSNSSDVTIQFSPTINASGNATAEDIITELEMSMAKFKSMMEDLQREQSRVAFG